jgi:hypothetical protein
MKPGYKTSEFWLSLAAMVVGALLASGILPADSTWLKLVGMASSVLATIGYTGSRMVAKRTDTIAKLGVTPKDPP